jgi:3-phenylpropionate/trans-cinnamate dioxygenase ferredoxin reductase subunit
MAEQPLEIDVLVAGAGHAAGVFARALRDLGYSGSILLVGEEAHLPYERPALSKEVLRDPAYVHAPILDAAAWEELEVQFILGRRVVSVDEAGRSARLDDGRAIKWGRLVLATGARPRRLPGPAHPARHVIRTIDDVRAIRARLDQGGDIAVVIVGAGPIGLEAAASLRPRAKTIMVVEATGGVMNRVAPPDLGEAIATAHRENDITLFLGTTVAEIMDRGATLDILLSNGERVPADLLIEGIGVAPEAPLAGAPGVVCENGIRVDQGYVTANPAIFAIGDVACPPGSRQETWAHAESSGRAAARSIMRLEPEALPVPSFWSDQFSRIQVAGDPMQASAAGRRGEAHLFEKDGTIVAAAAIGASRDFAAARRLIGKRIDAL